MKKFFLFLFLFALDLHQQTIIASPMQPMLISRSNEPTTLPHHSPENLLPHHEENMQDFLLLRYPPEQEQQHLTCFQKCFTTHSGPFCCNKCELKDTVQYSGGYCGACCEATTICSFLCMPACILCLACSGGF